MTVSSIPVVDVRDWHAGGDARARFTATVGAALADTGFFALAHHGIPEALTRRAYEAARAFFHLPADVKARYHRAGARGQRGYTGFGTEHARDSQAPDLKEFWQVGRTGVPDEHPVHRPFGPNLWPDEVVEDFRPALSELYQALDALGTICLELLRRDGTWMPVHVSFDHIVVDSGDMLQNVTNGLFKSTTHRVVNPADASSERFSMPCFIHPRREVDLTPMASAVARTGGAPRFPSLTAGEYLDQRLREIGLG